MASQGFGHDAINADNEHAPLRAVIVGRAEHSCFPDEPLDMVQATMPSEHHDQFRPKHPFPANVVENATRELEGLARLLESRGIKVYRPQVVDWSQTGGYTGSMSRDGLLTVGNTIIEAPFAWACRRDEIKLAYGDILDTLEKNKANRVVRAPKDYDSSIIYRTQSHTNGAANGTADHDTEHSWAINNSRPAFDAADFMRFGNLILGQLSNVTNMKGVEYLQAAVPPGYTVELLEVNDPHAMHIDATILPLRDGLLMYNPIRTTEAAIKKHRALRDWDCRPCPTPRTRQPGEPPLYMTSNWLMMNIISLDGNTIVVEESDTEFSDWLNGMGIDTIKLPFKHVHSLGGSFHCATVDILRY